ncbi:MULTISPECIES: hypothetical protein [Psychrobacillus]|uniref:Lipoprotein n=1 Tax=Psychrobacillus faecigallinarum TaxID=2762235 RepID=A0ABR8R9E3_9BACI|nr:MULTISPECIES: hypothetical protein [Psychrobacillus]MBD7944376.1 hypothetical protein [Psychrobacillus faecigallinarum]QEY19711.1 hypothetical protein D0S48_02835 [Psychrobacillus sp. AK 1817]QGM30248.1 hypothetical protein GI482_07600 [Bacillus sp. N3536]
MKKLIVLLILVLLPLTACGEDRTSNDVPPPETIDNTRDSITPESGNEEVNKENDEGMPNTNELNDPGLEGLKGDE